MSSGTNRDPSRAAGGERVLVIDDEASIRLLVRVNLEADGMQVTEASDGETGLELARSNPPDAVLLDLTMPGLDGWQVAEQLLADPRTSHVPIVFLTGRAELSEIAHGVEISGVDYVTKPFNPLELASRVRDLVGQGDPGDRRGEKVAELRALIGAV